MEEGRRVKREHDEGLDLTTERPRKVARRVKERETVDPMDD
jgi:hypothetical protein